MIIFPFGFYILEGKRPIYVGNDLQAQEAVLTWMDANQDKVRLRFDIVGPAQIVTKFLGWNAAFPSVSMDQAPLLFEATLEVDGQVAVRHLYNDYDAALMGHADLTERAKARLH